MRTPLFSIVLPTRNRGEELERAVGTVRAQENPDWELIIVDDGETDVKRYLPVDERVRYVRNDYRKGAPASRNAGISLSRGDFIAYLDDDDEWYPNHLSFNPECMRELDFLHSGSNIRRDGSVALWYIKSFSYNRLAQYNFIPTSSG